jgi:hypothetical protein
MREARAFKLMILKLLGLRSDRLRIGALGSSSPAVRLSLLIVIEGVGEAEGLNLDGWRESHVLAACARP